MKTDADVAIELQHQVEALKAELAALKARKCRTCSHFTQSRTSCALHGHNVFLLAIGPGEFCCNEWEATE